jgi:hypothetical protein
VKCLRQFSQLFIQSSLSITGVESENRRNHSDYSWCDRARFWRDYVYDKIESNRPWPDTSDCKKRKDDSFTSRFGSNLTHRRNRPVDHIRKTRNLAHHSKRAIPRPATISSRRAWRYESTYLQARFISTERSCIDFVGARFIAPCLFYYAIKKGAMNCAPTGFAVLFRKPKKRDSSRHPIGSAA